MTNPRGVVVDPPLGRAILFAAVEEGLLDNDPTFADGFVPHLLRNKPSKKLLDDAYEQLVLGGKVVLPFWVPRNWQGALFEEGIAEKVSEDFLIQKIEPTAVPSDIILGMLAARGTIWTAEELERRYREFLAAHEHWRAVANGQDFENLELQFVISRAFKTDLEKNYTPEQLSAWRTVSEKHSDLKVVLDCFNEYQQVVLGAMEMGALSGLPIQGPKFSSIKIREEHESTQQLALLEVACEHLHRVPIGTTLRDTIHMARSPEADALRGKLSEWSTGLASGQIEPASAVIADIERSRTSLAYSKGLSRAGSFLTCVAVPMAIAGVTPLASSAALAALGLVGAVAGAFVLGAQKDIEKASRWAMFGGS